MKPKFADRLLDGKATADQILKELKQEIHAKAKRPPGLAFLLIGDHPASKTYVEAKKKKCQEVGIRSIVQPCPSTLSTQELLQHIQALNDDASIDGILVQLPLPHHLDKQAILTSIDPSKDVDGFHPMNMGKLVIGSEDGLIPCTPLGIVELLQRNHISCEGKHAVIVGRSTIVGKPLALLLMQNKKGLNATVTIAHSKTPDLEKVCKSADLLIAAVGAPKCITEKMVKEGAIVVDVGINRLSTGELVGDVDFKAVSSHCARITPVPGGVGPMTIAMLMHNTWLAYVRRFTL